MSEKLIFWLFQMSSQLDELQISLLNDICENASYLQDSDDEIKQRLFDIIIDVEFEELEDENKPKLFNGTFRRNPNLGI